MINSVVLVVIVRCYLRLVLFGYFVGACVVYVCFLCFFLWIDRFAGFRLVGFCILGSFVGCCIVGFGVSVVASGGLVVFGLVVLVVTFVGLLSCDCGCVLGC